jgi:DNA repair protein RadC
MSIRHWPKAERPREKLLARGPHALSDAELLAVLIRCGRKGRSAVELARTLLADFGSLRELLSADRTRWVREPGTADNFGTPRYAGIGPARFATMQAALELTRRHYHESLRVGPAMNAPEATRKFLVAQLRDRPYEVFCCLHLDVRHRLIAFEEMFRGTLDGATVHVREVVRHAMAHNSAAVIFAHNHPSGVTEPSQADEITTQRLREALSLVDVRVLDHIIVGDGRCLSFAERGLL